MLFTCAHCGVETSRSPGHVNRAIALGNNLYCGKECSAIGRRKNKSVEQKKLDKAEYDRRYRIDNASALKIKKAAYHKRTYDPVMASVKRKKRMPAHVEYCRRPEYKKWKREYDRQYRASEYGVFGEAYLILVELNNEVLSRASRYEIDLQSETLNKKLRRRRDYDKAFSG